MGINRRLLRSTQMEKTPNPISTFHDPGTDNSLSFQYLRSFALSAVMKFPGASGMGINRRLLRSTQMEKTSNPISTFHDAGADNSLSFQYLRSFALSAVMKFPGVFGQRDLTANLPRSTQMEKTSNPISVFDHAGTDSSFSFQYLRLFALSAVTKFPGVFGQRD